MVQVLNAELEVFVYCSSFEEANYRAQLLQCLSRLLENFTFHKILLVWIKVLSKVVSNLLSISDGLLWRHFLNTYHLAIFFPRRWLISPVSLLQSYLLRTTVNFIHFTFYKVSKCYSCFSTSFFLLVKGFLFPVNWLL